MKFAAPGAPDTDAGPPYVIVFFYEGTELRARIRNVQSQEQWVMRGAEALRDVLANVTVKAATR